MEISPELADLLCSDACAPQDLWFAGTVIFLVFLYVASRFEILYLLR